MASPALELAIARTAKVIARPRATAKSAGPVKRRWGTVDAVNDASVPLTVDITMGSTQIEGVAVMSHYTPAEGDFVALDVVGSDVTVAGASYAGLVGDSADNTDLVNDPTTSATDEATSTQGVAATTTGLVDLDSGFVSQALDTSEPATPTVTLVGGLQMLMAMWDPVLTAAGIAVPRYVAQLAADPYFTVELQQQSLISGPAMWTGLSAETLYYVQVQAVGETGETSDWSATATGTTSTAGTSDLANDSITSAQLAAASVTAVELAEGAVGAGNVQAGAIGAVAIAAGSVTANALAANAITAGSAVIGSAAISDAQIASLNVSKLISGTISATTISLLGTTSMIESSGFVAGSTGWGIRGDGQAWFADASITGEIIAQSLLVGTNPTPTGYLGPTNAISFGGVAAIVGTAAGALIINTTTGQDIFAYAPLVVEGNITTGAAGAINAAGSVTANNNYQGYGPANQPVFLATHDGVAANIYLAWDSTNKRLLVNVNPALSNGAGASEYYCTTTATSG